MRKVVCYFILFPICLYVIGWCKFSCGYEHAQYLIDDNRRIPLWYPYEISESYGDVTLSNLWEAANADQNSRQRPVMRERLDGIAAFQVQSNAVCGVFHVKDRDRSSAGRDQSSVPTNYFVFVQEKLSCFEDERMYLAECARLGIDGRKRMSFEENFLDYCKREAPATPFNVLTYTFSHLSGGELIAAILCLVALWRLDKSEIGRY